MQQAFLGGLHPLQHARFGLDADQLGDAIGVQQEAAHNSTSRPVSLSRSKSSSRPTRGDSRKNCTRLLGWRDLTASCSNCSTGIMTTPSLPCRVMSCGPSVRAFRNSSLNRALAVCSCHGWPAVFREWRDLGMQSLSSQTGLTIYSIAYWAGHARPLHRTLVGARGYPLGPSPSRRMLPAAGEEIRPSEFDPRAQNPQELREPGGMRGPGGGGDEVAAGVRLVHGDLGIRSARGGDIGGYGGVATARFSSQHARRRQHLRGVTDGGDGFAGLGEMAYDFENAGIEADVFGRASAGDHERVV